MRVAGRFWTPAKGWSGGASGTDALAPQLVLFFGARAALERPEISPHAQAGLCELHNQTMTVAVLGER